MRGSIGLRSFPVSAKIGGDAWGPIFETDVGFRVVRRPDVAKSRDPYSLWTGSVCGHAHATDVVIQVVSR